MTSFFQNKIHSISTEKKKRKYIKGGMYETKVKSSKNFWPYLLHFSDFIKMNKNLEQLLEPVPTYVSYYTTF